MSIEVRYCITGVQRGGGVATVLRPPLLRLLLRISQKRHIFSIFGPLVSPPPFSFSVRPCIAAAGNNINTMIYDSENYIFI